MEQKYKIGDVLAIKGSNGKYHTFDTVRKIMTTKTETKDGAVIEVCYMGSSYSYRQDEPQLVRMVEAVVNEADVKEESKS